MCPSFARFLILKPKEELLDFIQAKPIAGLNLEHPKLFNISKEIIIDEKVAYWLEFLINKKNIGSNLLSAINSEISAYSNYAKADTLTTVLQLLKIDNADKRTSFGKAIFKEFEANCKSLLSKSRKIKVLTKFDPS
jgi:hypothetical protein